MAPIIHVLRGARLQKHLGCRRDARGAQRVALPFAANIRGRAPGVSWRRGSWCAADVSRASNANRRPILHHTHYCQHRVMGEGISGCVSGC